MGQTRTVGVEYVLRWHLLWQLTASITCQDCQPGYSGQAQPSQARSCPKLEAYAAPKGGWCSEDVVR